MWLDPELVLDLANSLWLKDYICTTNPLYHLAKVSMSWCATFWESAPARSCSSSRTNWRPLSAQGEMPVCKTLPCRGARDPVLATPYWVNLFWVGTCSMSCWPSLMTRNTHVGICDPGAAIVTNTSGSCSSRKGREGSHRHSPVQLKWSVHTSREPWSR